MQWFLKQFMNNLFSIIIPTYNRSGSLPNAIDSVLQQEAGNWDLIIIDDGSTDDTQAVIQNYLRDKRIKYSFQRNSGVSAARNKGIELARGNYVIFLDSDDLFLPGLISTLNTIEIENFDLVFWEVKKLFPDHSEIWKAQKLERIYNNITATFLAGSVCYKKEALIKSGGYDKELKFGENYELGMRIAQMENLKYKLITSPYLIYHVSDVRKNSKPSQKIESLKYLLEKHSQLYSEDVLSYSRLLYQLGYLSEKLKNKKKAKSYFKKALLVRPFYMKAFLKLIIHNFK